MGNTGDSNMKIVAPVLEPATQKFIDGLVAAGAPPLYTLSPEDARKVLISVQATPVTKLPASIEDTSSLLGRPEKMELGLGFLPILVFLGLLFLTPSFISHLRLS
jgi:hypothetical protein